MRKIMDYASVGMAYAAADRLCASSQVSVSSMRARDQVKMGNFVSRPGSDLSERRMSGAERKAAILLSK